MSRIIGNTTTTPVPRSNWAQTNETKADYILNKPELGALATKDVVEKNDLAEDIKASLSKVDEAIQALDGYATEDYVSEALESKADAEHSHDDQYYTEAEIDSKLSSKADASAIPDALADLTEDASHRTVTDAEKQTWNAKSDFSGSYDDLTNKPTNLVTTDDMDVHNTKDDAHNDIRVLVGDLTTKLNNFLDVDDTTSDQLSEVITMINNNKGTLESLTTSKVNVSDIIDNLTTSSADKVLSAKQGVAIKALIDALTAADVGALAEKAEVCADCDTEIKAGGQKTTLKKLTADSANSPNKLGHTSYTQGIVLTYAFSTAHGIQYAFLGGSIFVRNYADSTMGAWKLVATNDKVLLLDGSNSMTGNMVIEKNTPIVRLRDSVAGSEMTMFNANDRAYLQVVNDATSDKNRRQLQLADSEVQPISKAFQLVDIVDGNLKGYNIYHEGNKPTAVDVGAVKTYRSLSELNLTEATATPKAIVDAMDDYSILMYPMSGTATTSALATPRNYMFLTVTKISAGYAKFDIKGNAKDVEVLGYYGYYNSGAGTPWSGWIKPVNASGDTMTGSLSIERTSYPQVYLKDKTQNRYANLFYNENKEVVLENNGTSDGKNRTLLFLRDESKTSNLLQVSTVNDGTWKNYNVYHQGNKPTASDVGALSATGTAVAAAKLSNTQAIGSATQPVYFNASGVPVATTYTLGKSVPSDAVFTDTTYSAATQSAAGLMSAADKKKLDGIADGGGFTYGTADLTAGSSSLATGTLYFVYE